MARFLGYALPEPIGQQTYFFWGKVIQIHKIDCLKIKIVEYQDEDNIMFSIFINDEECGMSCNSLEQAIIHAIAIRHLGSNKVFNGNYAYFACKILELN